MRPIAVVLSIFVAATLACSVAVVRRLHDPDRRWRDVTSERLVMGVPWGTLVVVAFVVAVYLFVQDGISDPSDPVTIPYRASSYFNPLGMVTSSFAHASYGHLVGNMAATLVAAPIAEYAWGHYPDGRGARSVEPSDSRLRAWWTTPWLRAVVFFPLLVIGVGLVTSLFALGPVIGFSGVVFALTAFAIVHYPVVTLVGVLGVQSALTTIYRALREPIYIYTAEPRPPTAPSWAEIAIQGHALGFFTGLVVAIAVLEHRDARPDPLRVWIAILLYALSRGLWQIYWFGEGETYVRFQGPGVAIVAILALVITVALTGSERPAVPRRLERFLAGLRPGADDHPGTVAERPLELARGIRNRRGAANATANAGADATADTSARFDRIRDIARGRRTRERTRLSNATRRGAATTVVFLVLAVVAGIAIPYNLVVVDDAAAPDDAIEIEDYTIQYVEGAENQLVSGVGFDEAIDTSGLEANGVVVVSERRNIWMEVVTDQYLAHAGDETVTVGGPGWRETVRVDRAGWEPVGNDAVYHIRMWETGGEPAVVHESDGEMADVRVDGRLVTVVPRDGEFVLEVESAETVETTTIPAEGESTAANGLTFERERGTVYALSDGTVAAVATEETYN